MTPLPERATESEIHPFSEAGGAVAAILPQTGMREKVEMAHNLQVDWQVLLDENDWDRDELAANPHSKDPKTSLPARRYRANWLTAAAVLLLALAVGVRLWQQSQMGLAAVEESLAYTLTMEAEAVSSGDEVLAAALLDPQTDAVWHNRQLIEMEQVSESLPTAIEITEITLQGDRAMAQVRVTDGASGQIYRENRFYRETERGWLRSQPDPALWGSLRTFESEYFVFHFRQLDSGAVAEAAPQLDAVYLHIHRALGLPLLAAPSSEEKVAVHIAVAGGEYVGDIWYEDGLPLWVTSPRLLRLPEGVSAGSALAAEAAFSLRRGTVYRAIAPSSVDGVVTPEFLSGLRLWLAWQERAIVDGHVSELVSWLYGNAPYGPLGMPFSYLEICTLFGAWPVVPEHVSNVFYCAVEPPFAFLAYARPPINLHQMPLVVEGEILMNGDTNGPFTGALMLSRQGQPIAIATILEYAVHTYGLTSVADLLRSAQVGEDWHTAVPLLFGIAEESFEAGWWAWLADEYGVDTANFQDERPFETMHRLSTLRLTQARPQQIDGLHALAAYYLAILPDSATH